MGESAEREFVEPLRGIGGQECPPHMSAPHIDH